MIDRTSNLFVILTLTAACEAVSRNVGDLQTENGEELDLVELAIKFCESEQTCCVAPAKPGTPADGCEAQWYWSYQNEAEDGASYGLWADPECFERDAECHAPSTECERPCKLFYGTRGLGEACDRPLGKDNCAQGLVCQEYTTRIYECDDPFTKCSDTATRCIDPCAVGTDVECRNGDIPDRCGPGAYCDDVPGEDDTRDDTLGKCQPRPQIGESCAAPGALCAEGSFCDRVAVDGPTCVALLADGVPCAGDHQCTSTRCGRDFEDLPGDVCEPWLWWACEDDG